MSRTSRRSDLEKVIENSDRRGEPGAREIASVLGYESPDNLYNDLVSYKQEKGGKFTAEEFVEEHDIDPRGSVDGALSALGNFNYDIEASLEISEDELVKKFRVE